MTDDRLIELVEQGAPQELTSAELAEIRTRLATSPALREAMLSRLRIEQALHQSVGQFRLPVELLLAKAAAMQATSTVAKLFGWSSVTGLIIGLATVGTLVSQRDQPPPIERLIIDEPSSPSDVVTGRQGGVAPIGDRQTAAVSRQSGRPPGAARSRDAAELYFSGDQEATVWRQSLESIRGEVSQRKVGDRTELVLRGTQVLKSDSSWPAPGRMRLTLADHDRFKIHLSSSNSAAESLGSTDQPAWPASPSSLTLEYFAEPEPLWVAWLAAQRANQLLPEPLALAAHDGGAAFRAKAATIDVGYRAGEIVVTQGETELLAAPLAGAPDRIVFEGEAVVRGLAFTEGVASAIDRRVFPLVTEAAPPPGDRDWKCDLPTGAKWSTLAEGRVELFAEDSQADARAAFSLGDMRDIFDVCFQLEDPLAGTGIYLGDEGGEICYRLSFVPSDNGDRVCFAGAAPSVPALGPMPLCPVRPWFRLAIVDGTVEAWFSCNGAHWSRVLGPTATIDARITTAGVYCLAGAGSRSIRVARAAAAGAEPRHPQHADELFGRLRSRTESVLTVSWRVGRS